MRLAASRVRRSCLVALAALSLVPAVLAAGTSFRQLTVVEISGKTGRQTKIVDVFADGRVVSAAAGVAVASSRLSAADLDALAHALDGPELRSADPACDAAKGSDLDQTEISIRYGEKTVRLSSRCHIPRALGKLVRKLR